MRGSTGAYIPCCADVYSRREDTVSGNRGSSYSVSHTVWTLDVCLQGRGISCHVRLCIDEHTNGYLCIILFLSE